MCVMLGQVVWNAVPRFCGLHWQPPPLPVHLEQCLSQWGVPCFYLGLFLETRLKCPCRAQGLLLVWALLAVDLIWLGIPAAVITGFALDAWELVRSPSLPAFIEGLKRAQRPLWSCSCIDALYMLAAQMHIIAIWRTRVFELLTRALLPTLVCIGR